MGDRPQIERISGGHPCTILSSNIDTGRQVDTILPPLPPLQLLADVDTNESRLVFTRCFSLLAIRVRHTSPRTQYVGERSLSVLIKILSH